VKLISRNGREIVLNYDSSFIETQFPVSKISKESYKERKSNLRQTLTTLGKWWGRKPLILVRASLLGLLMPTSDDPVQDRKIFLKLLSMDSDGLWARKIKPITMREIYDNLSEREKKQFFTNNDNGKLAYQKGISLVQKNELQRLVFNRFSYDQKLQYCDLTENLENLPSETWKVVNEHFNTDVFSLKDLIKILGKRRFGSEVKVGDCFAGGGSIPFDAARIGLDVFASDLNPIATLLTWSSLNILSLNESEELELVGFQKEVFKEVDKQIKEWGIEENSKGHKANYFLYCNETVCPECNWKIPMLSSMVVGKRMDQVIVILKEKDDYSYDFEVKSGVTSKELSKADNSGTVQKNNLECPQCKTSTPITSLRKDKKRSDGSIEYGLRKWIDNEYTPREDDVFQERLYCIKWQETIVDYKGKKKEKRYYAAPTEEDLKREKEILDILSVNFDEWRDKGYLPKMQIDQGYNTSQVIRERGWTYWHHLFNPRQLLVNGLILKTFYEKSNKREESIIGLLGLNKILNFNSKLCRWNSARDFSADTFYNQALNTLSNYGARALSKLDEAWYININNGNDFSSGSIVETRDARSINEQCNIWITDPPYADAVNYHELTEFFLAWDKAVLRQVFPDWVIDSRRALAVKGKGESFNQSMVEVYRNLAENMPDNGMQVVMFTHQDVSVWADLSYILWSAGLRVTGAWNIATETESSGLKDGNYVKGTVLLVLRKQYSDETAYLDELYPEVEEEVKRQINSMRDLDDKEDPNFTDADYLLAAYAACLKVITSYKKIEDIDVNYEISKTKTKGELSPIERILNEAIKIAYDYLTPTGFDSFTWKTLIPEERFYIKGLDFEKENIYKLGAYQEIARGFGVKEYTPLLASTKANNTRLKTAREFTMRGMADSDKFGSSIFRNVLASLYQSIKSEDTLKGRNWLKNEVPNYWNQRTTIIELLNFISTLGHHEHMIHWEDEAKYARLLSELVKNDGV
jgi:putative DNA methylase